MQLFLLCQSIFLRTLTRRTGKHTLKLALVMGRSLYRCNQPVRVRESCRQQPIKRGFA
jgi:hypothetical protein